jgi:hypothetical protein
VSGTDFSLCCVNGIIGVGKALRPLGRSLARLSKHPTVDPTVGQGLSSVPFAICFCMPQVFDAGLIIFKGGRDETKNIHKRAYTLVGADRHGTYSGIFTYFLRRLYSSE